MNNKNAYESPELNVCWFEPAEDILSFSPGFDGVYPETGNDDGDW